MESELRSAWILAGVKLGLGLFFVAAVIGIRVVTVSPEPEDAANGASTSLAEPAPQATAPDRLRADPPVETTTADSVLGRVVDGVREQIPGERAGSRDGDKLVSCRLAGKTQFMRADDCAMRGGASKVFESDR